MQYRAAVHMPLTAAHVAASRRDVMKGPSSTERLIVETLLRLDFVSHSQLDEAAQRDSHLLNALLELGFVTAETLRSVVSYELRLLCSSDETALQMIDSVYTGAEHGDPSIHRRPERLCTRVAKARRDFGIVVVFLGQRSRNEGWHSNLL